MTRLLVRSCCRLALALLAWVGCAAPPASAGAPPWPARPLRIVVAQAPGGPPDLVARFVAEPLGRAFGVPAIVENRPGAGGIIGGEVVARAAADGHTLLVATLSTHALLPHVVARLPYDPLRDFAPVASLFRSIKVLWIGTAIPVRTLDEFVAYAQARPGRLNFASGGVGSSNHVDAALFAAATGIDIVHVPYNGPSAAIAAVASGEVQLMIVSITAGLTLAQGDRIRPLAVFAAARSPLLPDVPTARELGLQHVDLGAWIGLVAPAGTPAGVVDRVNAQLGEQLRAPETIAWARRQGLEIDGGSAADFARMLAADHARWGRVIEGLRLAPE